MRGDYRELYWTNDGYIVKHEDQWDYLKPKARKVNYKDKIGVSLLTQTETVFIRVAVGTDDLRESLKIFGVDIKDLRA